MASVVGAGHCPAVTIMATPNANDPLVQPSFRLGTLRTLGVEGDPKWRSMRPATRAAVHNSVRQPWALARCRNNSSSRVRSGLAEERESAGVGLGGAPAGAQAGELHPGVDRGSAAAQEGATSSRERYSWPSESPRTPGRQGVGPGQRRLAVGGRDLPAGPAVFNRRSQVDRNSTGGHRLTGINQDLSPL